VWYLRRVDHCLRVLHKQDAIGALISTKERGQVKTLSGTSLFAEHETNNSRLHEATR
jgi:hypothetical protein